MIEFQRVCKSFARRPGPGPGAGEIVAVREVTLSVPAGQVWGVVGPNGAGKTTLFALALGFLRPDKGSVRVDGAEPRAYLRRHGAAYLPERFQLPARWRVRPALKALARLEGLAGREAERRVTEGIERFGLETHADASVASLSRGLLQRMGLAQTALAERRLVVLDEPTQGLDPLWRVRFRAYVQELARGGRTVLIASHDLAELERMSNRVILLDQGSIREMLDLELAVPDRLAYRLELAGTTAAVSEIFPGAERMRGAAAEEAAADRSAGAEPPMARQTLAERATADGMSAPGAGALYRVTAANSAELTERLAALIEAGAIVASVIPERARLEERVRHALGDDA